jgi:membrane dipeptidase
MCAARSFIVGLSLIVDVKERFGSDILAIGTDFFGIETTPEGLEDVTKLPNLLEKLKEKGFSNRDISKISWENIVRVIRIHSSRW